MLSEEFFSTVCGPPVAANTAVSKDVGIYCHALSPSYAVKSTFKKSATPSSCLAISNSHVFAAQNEKSQVHVYSRARGNHEVTVTFPERIKSLCLVGDVLAVGTADGSLILWEVSHPFLLRRSLRTIDPHKLLRMKTWLTCPLDLYRQTSDHATLSCPAGLVPGFHASSSYHRL